MVFRRDQSSLSASGISIVRALEAEKLAAERVRYDPYARHSVSAELLDFVRFCNMRLCRWLSGEQLAFGISEGAVTAFLEQRGF